MLAKKQVVYRIVTMLIAGGILLAACAPKATPEPTQAVEPTNPAETSIAPAPTEKPFKVALIVTGVLADGSWNQFQYDSMKEIEKEPGIEVAYSENVAVPDFERVAGDYCRQGYDLIIGHTFDFQEPALQVSSSCPNTKIVITGGWQVGDNVGALTVWPCEGGYLAGVLGALMTQTNKLGLIGGFAYAQTQVCYHEGFKAGAQSINPDIEVVETWTGTWDDVAVGYEAAKAQIDSGVDFIGISLSGPGFGAIDAAKDYNATKPAHKVYAVGPFIDMNSRAPDTVITSVIWKATQPTLSIIDLIRQGKFQGINYEFFMKDGSVEMAPYHDLASEIPQDVQDKVAKVQQSLIDGSLKIEIVKEQPPTPNP